jgi:hypothetical protein
MLRKEGDKIYAVLNDFDLAGSADVKSMSSKHRTGTKPFMAIDLIHPDPTVHMYRHDLESMFYVLVWITSRFHDGQEIVDPPLQEWADSGSATLLKEKNYSWCPCLPDEQNDSNHSDVASFLCRQIFMMDFGRVRDTFPNFRLAHKHHLLCISPTTHSMAWSRLTSFKQFLMPAYRDMYCVCPHSIYCFFLNP